ncbi:MAG: hypothetical protein IJP64_08280 [Oscillospiraceae bacterium]|nr:hypothetical protein [Oscillospiraceae bacterium]
MKDHIRAAIIPLIFLGSFLFLEPFRDTPIAVLFLAVPYCIIAGLALLIVWRKKKRSKEEYEKPVFRGNLFLTVLWRGDWIKTDDPRKRTLTLILARMGIPVVFYGSAAFLFLRDLTGDPLTIFLVWLTLGFGFSAWSILRNTIKEERERQTAHLHDSGQDSESEYERRKKQLDGFLEAGLIDHKEYVAQLERRKTNY